MSYEYWYLFPVGIAVAAVANASGFSGGVLFQPIINIFLNIPVQGAVATGVATETIGMTSGAIRYLYYKMVDLPIAFAMIMLAIPGVVLGNHALSIINESLLKLVLGLIILVIASVQLIGAAQKHFGKRDSVPVEDIYPYMWILPFSGFFSSTTGNGLAESAQPILEKGLDLKVKRANGTAVLIQAVCDWITSILNFHSGFLIWEILIFTIPGVIIGAQIGVWSSKYLPERLLKIAFSLCILVIGVFYIHKGYLWIRYG
jgi:uncharacterized membrane protein YfcA